MKKLLSVILSVAIFLSLGTVVLGKEIDNMKTPEKIKVGINAEFKPFEYYGEDGELTGFDIDLMNYIGERTGLEIEFVDMTFDKLIPSVVSGVVDCAISAITVTEERDRVIDYSREYLKTDITTYNDGEPSRKRGEYYAVVMREGLSGSPYEELTNPTRDQEVYIMIDAALRDLSQDRTVMKLIEKYELNKPTDENAEENVEYSAIMGDGDPTAKPEMDEENKISATSVKPSDWAVADIEKAQALNIINYGGNYNFPAPITREEFCELIYNYCANVVKKVDVVTGENKFTDTANSNIIRLNAMGIINGKSETKFAPHDLLTREEAAVILNRMVNKTGPVPVTEMYFVFDDREAIADWASNSIQVMCNMGVMNGVGENKFAPKGTYTTEQAIATIVRVYAVQSANSGIIDGADAATEIYVGEDVEISEFYIEEALKHTKKAGELAGTKEFISMYIADEETGASIEKLSGTDFENPEGMYYLTYNFDKVVEYYNELIKEENPEEKFDIKKYLELNGFNLSVFATKINGRFGATTLAATAVLTSREGYIMPESFERDFGIYLQYDGDYSALVTFNKIGEGVIEGHMQFVRNGEKKDMLMFMSELYDALGKECITIGKIVTG